MEKHGIAFAKGLILRAANYRRLQMQQVSLWKKRLLSRTLHAYESGLDSDSIPQCPHTPERDNPVTAPEYLY